MYFDNIQQFIDIFSLQSGKYIEITPFIDGTIGFSVQREYEGNLNYIPPKTKDGKVDTAALIHVIYDKKKSVDPDWVPIILSIGTFSRYFASKLFYKFDDLDCPTMESLNISKNSPKPVSLDSIGDYYVKEGKLLVDMNKNKVDGEQILDELFAKHCSTVKLPYLAKKQVKNMRIRYHEKLSELMVMLYNILFGKQLELNKFYNLYHKDDAKDIEYVNVFGYYRISKAILILFSGLIFLTFIFSYKFHYKYIFISTLYSINLVAVSFSILVIAIMEYSIPKMLLYLINLSIAGRRKIAYKNIKL